MNGPGGSWAATLLPFVIVAIVLALRFRSMSRSRPLKLNTLWIVPLMYVLIAGAAIFALPPSAAGWAIILVAIIMGAVIGWHRGKLIHIERNFETNELRQRASPLAMLLIAAVVALKLGAKTIFGEAAATHAASGATLLTDGFVGFALGLLIATRLELYLRGRRLVDAS